MPEQLGALLGLSWERRTGETDFSLSCQRLQTRQAHREHWHGGYR